MDKTLTIRLPSEERDALVRYARRLGKTVSELAREILRQGVSGKPRGARLGHLNGRLDLSQARLKGWRKEIRDHNWRR